MEGEGATVNRLQHAPPTHHQDNACRGREGRKAGKREGKGGGEEGEEGKGKGRVEGREIWGEEKNGRNWRGGRGVWQGGRGRV